MSDLVQKFWGFCHTLRHDGIDYGDYIEQITYLLFLKMADERRIDLSRVRAALPEGGERVIDCSWPALERRAGLDLTTHYKAVLGALGQQAGLLGDIFKEALSRFNSADNLQRLIGLIDETRWTALDVDVKAAVFEGLLEKAADEGKKGAGQYFTPRVLIQTIVHCVQPDPRVNPDLAVCDPACGTGGFLVGAYEWLLAQQGGELPSYLAPRVRRGTYFGQELVRRPRRLALMNLYLHGLEPEIALGDSIYEAPGGRRFDVVLTNPPFGTKGAKQVPPRPDMPVATSNKQLNFLQHVLTILKPGGRAAVVVPDNCLFADQAGEVFRNLTQDCDLHTVLRLPNGTFTPYSAGTKTNVVFFTKGRPTEDVWVFDARTNMPRITKKDRPLTPAHFAAFKACYGTDPDGASRRSSGDSLEDRWRSFSITDIRARDFKIDSLKWLRDESLDDDDLSEPDDLIEEATTWLQAALSQLDGIRESLAGESPKRPQLVREVELTVFDERSRPNLARDGSVLPEGWSEISLAEVVVHRIGGEWGEDHPGEGRVQVRVVRGTEFREWERDKAKTAALRWILATRLASRELRTGDIVIEISGGGPEQPVGRTLLIDQEALGEEPVLPLICGNFCRLLRINPALDPAFVHLALREKYLRGEIWEFQNQTTNLRNLQLDEYLDGTFLRVPPLTEQRRIVAAATDLLSRAVKAQEGLLRAQGFLRKLRQAVLAAGTEGRLTEDWRRERSEPLPLAATFANVFVERKNSFDSSLRQASLDGSRLKPPINLDPGSWQVPEPLFLPELPPGWMMAPLQDLVENLQYGTSRRADKNLKDGVPVLRMGNIREGRIDARRASLKLISPADEDIPRYTLRRGDILFNRTNSPELVGKAAVYDLDGPPMIFASYLVRITCDDRLVLPEYLCGWINSPWGRRWARTVRTDCVSQSNINATKLRTMPVPLPPLDEQREIVRRSRDASVFAAGVEEALAQALGNADRLARAILEQAMRGDLVPSEADLARLDGREFEQGTILLDRVRTDHLNGNPQKRKSRRRKLRGLTTEAVLAAIRRTAWGSLDRTVEDLVAAVALRLKKVSEPSPEMQAWLRDHLEIAVERRILTLKGDRLVAATPKIGRYDFEFLVNVLGRAMRREVSYDRKQLNRTVASWLGYDQVTSPMADRLDEVRQEAVRRGLLRAEGERYRFASAS